jgi:hypothetical protein
MTYPFAGGEVEAFVRSGTNVAEDTTAGTFDATYARCSIKVGANTSGDYMETTQLGSLTTLWLHFEYYQPTSISALPLVTWYNSSGVTVFRLTSAAGGSGSATFKLQYWNGSAFVDVGTTFTLLASNRQIVDIKLICGASGSFEVYVGNSIQASGSGFNAAVTNVDKVRFHCNNSSGFSGRDPQISQVICSTGSTIGHKLYLKPPTGNGANTAFTGTFADVDETALLDSDFIESTAANDIETYTHAAISFGSGTIKAVVVSARALVAATGPQNLQAALRIGSTNYFSANLPNLGAGFGPVVAVFENDPSTGGAWGTANAGGVGTEFGLKSIA